MLNGENYHVTILNEINVTEKTVEKNIPRFQKTLRKNAEKLRKVARKVANRTTLKKQADLPFYTRGRP